jgi:hypothetical protein
MFTETVDFLRDNSHPHSKILTEQKVLLDYFPLTDGKTIYRSMGINVSLIRKQNPAVWTSVLDTFLSATKDVSLPSPLTVGVNYLSKFSQDVLQKYLPDPNAEKRLDLGQLAFVVSDDPSQLNRITATGLHLRVLQPTGSGNGWIDPSRWDTYCFYTKFVTSNWIVYISPKDSTASDKDAEGCPSSKYTPLMNDYVPLLIEAEQIPTKTANDLALHLKAFGMGTGNSAVATLNARGAELQKTAIAQCAVFNVKDVNCPALRAKSRHVAAGH